MSEIKVETTTEQIEKTKSIYTTTDGKRFDDRCDALEWQQYLDAKEIYIDLQSYSGWYLIRNKEEHDALYLYMSGGEYSSNSGTYEEYPVLIKLESIYSDRDNYRKEVSEYLYVRDLKSLKRLIKEIE